MKHERWQEIEELFHAALDQPPARLTAFLDDACRSDLELRRQVEALLASFEEAGDFIEQPPLEGAISSIVEQSSDEQASANIQGLAGHQIGHYEIQSLIGVGGMGEVYLARDVTLDRRIAIKILPARFTQDDAQVKRFDREARAASALNHPNIITIHEIGRDGETHFIATEFVDGQTLREKTAAGQLSVTEAISISIQIAEALGAAHAAGIVHRDIKPENVMVRPDGLVKVLDFGLAKPVAREPASDLQLPIAITMRTDPGILMGTLAYLSPEQVQRQEVDGRTDLFSLGVVLYELVMGGRPFVGDSAAAICEAILRQPVQVELPDIPIDLRRVIHRALEKDPSARYQTAAEIRDDLQKLVGDPRTESRGLLSSWRGKAAVIAVVLMILIAVVSWSARRGTKPGVIPFSTGPVRRITDTPGWETFPSLSPDGQSIIYSSRASGSWDIYLKRIGESQAVNLTPDGRHVDLSPAFSPDGSRIAFSSSREGQGIFLMDADGKNLTKLAPDGYNPNWSPDGSEIAYAEDRIFDSEGRNHSHSRLFAVNVSTGDRRLISDDDAVQPNWSPNGHRIAFWGVQKGGHRDIWTIPAAGGKPVAVTSDREIDWNPIWSRDGKYLYFLSDRGGSMNLWRVPIDELSGGVTGPIEPATLPSANSQHISFSADGHALVYVEVNRRENTFQVDFEPSTCRVVGQPVQITQGIRRFSSPEVSPDEKSLVFVSAAEAQEDVFVIDRETGQARQLTNDPAANRLPRWSPDGQQIVFLSDRSGKYEVWRVNVDGSGLDQLTDVPEADLVSAVWSPDGRRLLYQMRNVNSFIIEPDKPPGDRTPQPLIGEQMPSLIPWSWSPDGKLIAGSQFDPQLATRGIVVYSFSDHKYERVTTHGTSPIWMADGKRIVFSELNRLFVLNMVTREEHEIHNLGRDNFGAFALSRDNRRLYYSLISTEADIHLLSLK